MSEFLTDKKEIAKVKGNAVTYARLFLTKKYHEEYKQLYIAYCMNRGVKINPAGRPTAASDVDERLILAQRNYNV